MKRLLIVTIFALSVLTAFSQKDIQVENKFAGSFNKAYLLNPSIPRGILEAVSYTQTRFSHIPESEPQSCTGMPKTYGLMGLVLDGKNYFRNNLLFIADLSGYTKDEIITNPEKHVLAYSAAFSKIVQQLNISGNKPEDYIPVLVELSELPVKDKTDLGNDYAINTYLYSILTFVNNMDFQVRYGFPSYKVDLKSCFGENNYRVLSSHFVSVSDTAITDNNGFQYKLSNKVACPDYPMSNCSWVASPNFSSRNGTAITSVAMHTVQGSYSGCISWFQNTSASASTQYVVRSSDGQLCQMVHEADKAWHVTTENPYTIGYEHEGYVDNPAWYTVAMYQSSANLTKDICQAYGINTLRTFCRDTLDNGTALDYGLHNLGGDGSCIKIKGHQHYPGQTHTDPAQYWCWDYYYKLMNLGVGTVTTLNAASGTFYDSGGASGNYGDDERRFWLIQPANASTVTVTFSSFALEANYDFVYIYDGDSEFDHRIGRFNTQSPGTITSTGGSLLVEFRSDCATTGAGWTASWTSTSVDNIEPTTTISTPGTWKTNDFTATFTDADNSGGSGIEKSYYQVLDNNGTEWRANGTNGFFADNFDSAINPEWTAATGTWSINNGSLQQSDEGVSNSNIYASLTQNLSNRYLYHFVAKAEGAGTNRRFGFHFFSDNGSLTNRGNSYFIWFRIDLTTMEFFKVDNDVLPATAQSVVNNVITTPGQWYDYKIIYDRTTGKTDVYRDNALLGTFTFASPFSNGSYISFRGGNCQLFVNELKVYRSRLPSVNVTVGLEASNDIRYQNPNPATYGAKIKSIVNDANGNLSDIAFHDLNVDWTPPDSILTINDGTGADIDTTDVSSSLSANWMAASDPNSGVVKYRYAIGTTPGGVNITGWTDNGLNTSFTQPGLSLSGGQRYYVSVKSENAAGLISATSISDGVLVGNSTLAGFTSSVTTICPGDTVFYTNASSGAVSYVWTFEGGTPSSSTQTNPVVIYNAAGNFNVEMNANGIIDSVTVTQPGYITVNAPPEALFTVSDTAVSLPGALVLFYNGTLNADSYEWNFGDGSISYDINPWHIYDTLGYYTISLVAHNSQCGTDTVTLYNYIHVFYKVEAEFAANPTNICTGDTVFFNNASSAATSFLWTFDGGTPSSSTEVNPSVAYLNSGIFDVTLTAFNGADSSVYFSSGLISADTLPIAGFSWSDTLVFLSSAAVQFTNSSVNAISYLWDFSDANDSYEQDPLHIFTDTGYYGITLFAINNCGTSTLVYDSLIHVTNFNSVESIIRNASISVIPNPFADMFTLSLLPDAGASIEIVLIDLLGKETHLLTKTGIPSGNCKMTFDGRMLSQGVYLLKVITNNRAEYIKLIKE